MCELVWHVHKLVQQAAKQDLIPVVRLNGSSDIAYERAKIRAYGGKTIFEIFPNVQFVDYTKKLNRLTDNVPANLDLTFSLHEENRDKAAEAIRRGFNVAVVFADFLPDEYDLGDGPIQVIDGDKHDLRFLDPTKGPQGKNSGMVVIKVPRPATKTMKIEAIKNTEATAKALLVQRLQQRHGYSRIIPT